MTGPVAAPATLRRLDSPAAEELAAWCAVFDDLQVVLRCCEWLVTALARPPEEAPPDQEVLVEAVWTTAVLSYGRCFGLRRHAALTDADLTATQPHGDVASWHQVLLAVRDHHTHPTANPREVFTVGVAQGDDGTAEGIALTSAHRPSVDLLTVRQTGAIAYGLSALVDERITARQAALLGDVASCTREELDRLPTVEVAGTT